MQNFTLVNLCALVFCTLIGCAQTSVQEMEGESIVQKTSEETLNLELTNQPDVVKNEAQLSISQGGNASSAPVETHQLQFPKGSGDRASRNPIEMTLKLPAQAYVKCPSKRPEVCTRELMPVCAEIIVNCIVAPCPGHKETFPNACEACASRSVNGYRPGVCDEIN